MFGGHTGFCSRNGSVTIRLLPGVVITNVECPYQVMESFCIAMTPFCDPSRDWATGAMIDGRAAGRVAGRESGVVFTTEIASKQSNIFFVLVKKGAFISLLALFTLWLEVSTISVVSTVSVVAAVSVVSATV